MKGSTSALTLALFAALGSFSTLRAQVLSPPSSGPRNPPTSGPVTMDDLRLNSQMREIQNGLRTGPDGASRFRGADYYGSYLGIDLVERREKLLKPTKAERAPYTQFLKQPNVGLIRLLPNSGRVVSVQELARTPKAKQTPGMFPGGGSVYSFVKKMHDPAFAELRLAGEKFEVGFGFDVLGAMISLADLPLDAVTTDNPAIGELSQYVRPARRKQAASEFDRFKIGTMLGSYHARASLPVRDQTTYAFRSIAYGRDDLIIAFRVEKLNEDGSVLLLWKRIAKSAAPRLKK